MSKTSSSSDSDAEPPAWDALWLWDDREARDGAEDMAVDELLLRSRLSLPVLRVYRWSRPAASIGIGHDADAARAAVGLGVPIIRRWTGGGLVRHGADQTYTLVVPADGWSGAAAWQNSIRLYRHVHQCLSLALRDLGIAATCAADGRQVPSGDCFQSPVRFDVMDGIRKLAGAGQRRTRDGILMQGSLQGPAARDDVVRALAARLAAASPALPAEWIPLPTEVEETARRRYPNLP